jgi:hypothetical protein
MTEQILTPETLTFEHIKAWSGDEMKKHMSSPLREAIYRVVQSRSLGEVEAVAAAQAVNEPIVSDPVVAPVDPVVAPVAPVVPVSTKVIVDYQVKDDDGLPLGRPTHLEADSQEEMTQKIIEAHTQATRAFHRLKKQKVTTLREHQTANLPAVPAPTMTDSELLIAAKDLKSDDPAVALAAHRKLNKAEADKQAEEYRIRLAEADEKNRAEKVSHAFLRNHVNDFNNCQANIELVKEYFVEHDLPWTADNLEIAFHDLEPKLAPVVPVAPTVAANPQPVVTVPAVPVAPPVVQPVVAAPTPVAAPANLAPAIPRSGVNGGIIPGQTSGVRPEVKPTGITIAEIRSWDGPTMRAKMRNPQLRAQIEEAVLAAQSRK